VPKKIVLSPEIRADFDFLSNTFISKDKEPEVEVGDIKLANFEPQVKIKRWGNEANFSIRLLDAAPGQATLAVDKEKVVWAKGDREAHFYAQGFGVDNGAFELEVVLLSKPTSNVISFSIQSKLLKFLYQPPLTQQEVDAGVSRPEKVVGSYAVYHATRGNMHPSEAEAAKYKVGKAFHIYRPRVTDAVGKETWAALSIDEQAGTLAITIDQGWLDAASYPVSIDPTFGYTTKGSSGTIGTANYIQAGKFAASEAGTVTSMTAAVFAKVTSGNIKYALYKNSDKSLVGDTEEWTVTSAYDDWKTLDIISGGAITATDYDLAFWPSGEDELWYDASGGTTYYDDQAYDGWPDPYAQTAWSTPRFSIYCTYTAGGGITVTPTTLALILSEFAPTVTTPRLVTPSTLALILSEFAPTVTATANRLVTPPTLALTLATFAPTATATENQLVTPPVLALILSEFAPTVTATGNVVVTPSTLALTLAAFAPTVATPRLVIPPTLALVLTKFAPTIEIGVVIVPTTLALNLSTFAPTVAAPRLVTPTTLALLLTEFAPTVTVGGVIAYTSYGGPFLYTAANWNAAVEFFLEVYLKAIAGTVRARLYNDTDATVVADSGLSTAATSYTRLRSSALSLTDGKIYLVQFGTESVANGEFKAGKLIAV